MVADMWNSIGKEEIVRKGYDKIARLYQADRQIFHTRDLREILKEFVSLLPKNAKVLDVGCGAGVPVAYSFAESRLDVSGVDFSESMLNIARKSVPKASFINADMSQLCFRKNSFDGLTSFYAVFHVPRERHPMLFLDFQRILKSDGIMLVSMSEGEWEEIGEYYGTKMFWSHYGLQKSLHMIHTAGFQTIWVKEIESGGEKHQYILAGKRENMVSPVPKG